MKKILIPICILGVFFMILTEGLALSSAVFAVGIAGMVYLLNREEIQSIQGFSLRTIPLWGLYIVLLLKEVVVANVQVAMIALSPRLDITPHIIQYESDLEGELLLTILANSITLTPGTMTVDIKGRMLKIHCLNEAYAAGVQRNDLEKLLLRIEGVNNE